MQINPARFVTLPDYGRIPVGKVLCIGRNYAAHAAEMKSAVPTTPMVFLKPSTALTPSGSAVVLPAEVGEVHHEVELVAVVGKTLRHASEDEAASAVAAYAVGLDMTARDVQAEAKKNGHPWSVAKGYDTFAPRGRPMPAGALDPANLEIVLRINDEIVQQGSTSDMIFSVPALLSYCSRVFTLEPGDLLYTGTPEGVGPVRAGDSLRAEITGLPPLEVTVRDEDA